MTGILSRSRCVKQKLHAYSFLRDTILWYIGIFNVEIITQNMFDRRINAVGPFRLRI